MSGKRQKIQYSLALELEDRGETPVSGYQGTREGQCSITWSGARVSERWSSRGCANYKAELQGLTPSPPRTRGPWN
jgi:hypothetical protein